jgi:LPXTG-motif cell wall-anchored protein
MAYELRNTTTGEDMRMLHREWELLLVLAERYDWRPAKGRNYARGGRFFHMDAIRMSAALSRALLDIPYSYADKAETPQAKAKAAPQAKKAEQKQLPKTGGSIASMFTLGFGVALIAGGLLARKLVK